MIKAYVYNTENFNKIGNDAYNKSVQARSSLVEAKFKTWTDEQMIELCDYLAKKYQKSRDSYCASPSWSKGGKMKHDEEVFCVVSCICDRRGLTNRCFNPYED